MKRLICSILNGEWMRHILKSTDNGNTFPKSDFSNNRESHTKVDPIVKTAFSNIKI